MMQPRKVTALLALLGALFAHLPVLHACAVCLTGADGAVADAYDWSVLFLMATPYLVIGSIAGYLVYAYRRATANAAKEAQEAAAGEASIHLALDHKESGR
jgi:hypothetical protein